MSVFESAVTIAKPVANVYSFLADLNNHRQLMPDNVIDWQSTADEASFEIQNITRLSIKIDNRIPNREVLIIPSEKPPFDMSLVWQLEDAGDQTNVKFTINAELNMMLKMLASSQLQKLANEETQRLAVSLV